MKIGYNEGCSRENSDLALDLVLSEKAGFDYIEPHLLKLREYFQKRSLDDLKRFFAGSRLKPHAINGIYLYDGFLLENDRPEHTRALLEEIRFACATALEIGSPAIIVVPPMNPEAANQPFGLPWSETLPRLAATLKKLSELAGGYGVRLALELVGSPRCSVRTLSQAKEVIDAVACPNVGYTLDAFNLYLYNKLNHFEEIAALDPEKIFVVHINGAERDMPAEDLRQKHRTFCDRGVLDVPGFLRSLAATGYNGMVSIEFFREDCWAKPAEWVIEEAYRTTRAAMERCGVYPAK